MDSCTKVSHTKFESQYCFKRMKRKQKIIWYRTRTRTPKEHHLNIEMPEWRVRPKHTTPIMTRIKRSNDKKNTNTHTNWRLPPFRQNKELVRLVYCFMVRYCCCCCIVCVCVCLQSVICLMILNGTHVIIADRFVVSKCNNMHTHRNGGKKSLTK